jgi:predicted nucleic acid-binding protein
MQATEAVYIDTSAIVKLYTKEPDSNACEAIVAGKTLVSSVLLYCELRSALAGKEARGAISESVRTEVWSEFEAAIADRRIRLITVSDLLVQEAADLVSHMHPHIPLRTLDAVHLATYLSVDAGPLFTKDLRMLQAARKLGLPLAC